MFDWNDIRCFLAVARDGSTLAAARTLGVNQTTVARRIEALEQALHLKLFERGKSGSRLTEAGHALIGSAEALERSAQALKDQAAAHARGLAGVVRVTTNESLSNFCLMPAMPEFSRLFPDIQVQVIIDDRFLDLWKGEADVSIRGTREVTDPGLISRRVVDVPWAVYASRDYVARHGRPSTPEDLNDHFLIGGEDRYAGIHAIKWMLDAAPRGKVLVRGNTLTNIYQAVRAGVGCAPLPRLVVGRDPQFVDCMPTPEMDGIFMLTTPLLRDAPRVRAFLDFMAPNLQSAIRRLNEEATRAPTSPGS
ncbi:MAG: LysR family transcriptional regulator [Caulobacteraceae bacterium]